MSHVTHRGSIGDKLGTDGAGKTVSCETSCLDQAERVVAPWGSAGLADQPHCH